MSLPIFILAGQSNALGMEASLRADLDSRYGAEGYLLITAAADGAPLTFQRALDDWYNADEMLTPLIDETLAALDAHPDATIEGLLWLQGEADTYAIARADSYADDLAGLFGTFRTAIDEAAGDRETGIDSANFVISELSDYAGAAESRPNWQAIGAAQESVAASDGHVMIVDPDAVATDLNYDPAAMFRDGLHYTNAFYSILAASMVDAALSGPTVHQGTDGGDVLIGTSGDDTFFVNSIADTVIEERNAGHDTVISSVSFELRTHSQYLEDLTLTGSANLTGKGSALDNVIRGNAGDNKLSGLYGNDTLIGGAGRDQLIGGSGDDVLIGGSGADRLTGGSGADVFVFDDAGVWAEKVTDFEDGIDRIDLSGTGLAGFDDVSVWQTSGGTIVNYGTASILLMGIDHTLLDAGDFLF